MMCEISRGVMACLAMLTLFGCQKTSVDAEVTRELPEGSQPYYKIPIERLDPDDPNNKSSFEDPDKYDAIYCTIPTSGSYDVPIGRNGVTHTIFDRICVGYEIEYFREGDNTETRLLSSAAVSQNTSGFKAIRPDDVSFTSQLMKRSDPSKVYIETKHGSHQRVCEHQKRYPELMQHRSVGRGEIDVFANSSEKGWLIISHYGPQKCSNAEMKGHVHSGRNSPFLKIACKANNLCSFNNPGVYAFNSHPDETMELTYQWGYERGSLVTDTIPIPPREGDYLLGCSCWRVNVLDINFTK